MYSAGWRKFLVMRMRHRKSKVTTIRGRERVTFLEFGAAREEALDDEYEQD